MFRLGSYLKQQRGNPGHHSHQRAPNTYAPRHLMVSAQTKDSAKYKPKQTHWMRLRKQAKGWNEQIVWWEKFGALQSFPIDFKIFQKKCPLAKQNRPCPFQHVQRWNSSPAKSKETTVKHKINTNVLFLSLLIETVLTFLSRQTIPVLGSNMIPNGLLATWRMNHTHQNKDL